MVASYLNANDVPCLVVPLGHYVRITSYNVCYTKLLRTVVLGGLTATRFAADVLDACPEVDAVVAGDAEALEAARLDRRALAARRVGVVMGTTVRNNFV